MRLFVALVLVLALSPAALANPKKKKAPQPSPQPSPRTTRVRQDSDGWTLDRRIPSKGPIRRSEVPRLLKKMNHPDARR